MYVAYSAHVAFHREGLLRSCVALGTLHASSTRLCSFAFVEYIACVEYTALRALRTLQ